jgi:UDP-N-acetylglucosamine 1-carboxyvinyltransferase
LQPSGNKNAALPVLAAALLCRGKSLLSNLPATTDVQHMVGAASQLGAEIHLQGSELELVPPGIPGIQIGPPLPTSPQASLLLAAASLHATGHATLAPLNPYKERLATHCHVLSSFDIAIEVEDSVTKLHAGKPLAAQEVWLPEASVTATELAILLAARAEGTSVLHNAACEPHVQDLARFLIACGARIEGSGSNWLVVQGYWCLGPIITQPTRRPKPSPWPR